MKVAAVRLSDTGARWLTFDDPVPMDAIGRIVQRNGKRPAKKRVNWKAIEAMNEARRKVPVGDRQSLVDEYVETDISLQRLADRYGASGEWMRVIIRDHDPSAPHRRKERQQQERVAKTFARACRKALAENRVCKTCGGWILRATSDTTCSEECTEAYRTLRIFDDPDYHRRALAKVYLRSPDKYSKSNLEWARRMLGPNPPKRNRTYLVPGSKRAEVIKKYRPERYAELLGDHA